MPSPGEDIQSWSTVAANNGSSDPLIVWSEGQTRASVNNSSRSEMAAIAKHRNLLNGSIVTTGTANAQAFLSGLAYTTIPTNLVVRLKIGSGLTNTGSMTLNMDGLGDTLVKFADGDNLEAGEVNADYYADFVYNGTNWIFLGEIDKIRDLITQGDGIVLNVQTFTSGAFTYTPHAKMRSIIVECIGGGGGGGGGWSTVTNTMFQGGGGGGGGYSRKFVLRSEVDALGGTIAGTVGAAGLAGTNGGGGSGGMTNFGSLCTAYGGGGGQWAKFDLEPTPGDGAAAGVGDIAIAGTPGNFGMFARSASDIYTTIGNGGPGPLGGGSHGATLGPGGNGNGPGSGGAGGSSYNGGSIYQPGGAGAGGLVIVTEFAGVGVPGANGATGPAGPMGPQGPAGAGTGDVLVSGTPTAGQMAQWVSASQITGVPSPASAWGTGDIKATFKTTADSGWIMLNDGTMGDASSGGTTRANADTFDLFALLWSNISDANAPVSGGRGASAAADFAAHKTITLPKAIGRVMMGAGTGASITTALGQQAGAATHAMTIAEMPVHGHTFTSAGSASGDVQAGSGAGSIWNGLGIASTNNAGSGIAMSLQQPSVSVNFMCKL